MKRLLYIILGLIVSFYIFCFIMAIRYPRGFVLHSSSKKNDLRLDIDSLSNVQIIADSNGSEGEKPCPLELTNVVSNTNLFKLDEQKLIESIPLIYGHVTTNSRPVGSVPIAFSRSGYFWKARFQFTNSGMVDEVTPGGDMLLHRVRDASGNGYDLRVLGMCSGFGYGGNGSKRLEFSLTQIRHDTRDGLDVSIVGDHCERWMRFSNGMAVDKWLIWNPNNGNLMIWVKFKKPYDYLKYSKTGFGS
jgi:hypothetical protein